MWFGEPHRLPKEVHLPDWARRDKQGTKGDRVEYAAYTVKYSWWWIVNQFETCRGWLLK